MTLEAVLASLLLLPHYVGDRHETKEQRRELYTVPAMVIHEAAKGDPFWVAALTVVAEAESRLARYVLEGRCTDGPKGAQCDYSYRLKRPLSRGMFQLRPEACPAAYAHPEGSLESMRAEAKCARRLLAGAKHRCRGVHPDGDLAGMFSGYRSVSCVWRPAAIRARRLEALRGTAGSPQR